MKLVERICPKCGIHYTDYPALSRVDNQTEICPECGVAEAIESWLSFKKTEEERV